MKKIFIRSLITATLIGLVSIVMLCGCQKETGSKHAETQITNGKPPMQKWYHADGYVVGENQYIASSSFEAYWATNYTGGTIWIWVWINGVQVRKELPIIPWWRDNTTTPPPPSFVQQTIENIMQATTIADRRALVIENDTEETGDNVIKLRHVIKSDIFDKVITGEYTIYLIKKEVQVNAAEIIFNYHISFNNTGGTNTGGSNADGTNTGTNTGGTNTDGTNTGTNTGSNDITETVTFVWVQ